MQQTNGCGGILSGQGDDDEDEEGEGGGGGSNVGAVLQALAPLVNLLSGVSTAVSGPGGVSGPVSIGRLLVAHTEHAESSIQHPHRSLINAIPVYRE